MLVTATVSVCSVDDPKGEVKIGLSGFVQEAFCCD